jgi:uncharacterized membrane protein
MLVVILLLSMTLLPAVSALPQAPRLRPAPDPAPGRAVAAVEDKLFIRTNGTGNTLTMSTVAGTGGSLRALPAEAAIPNGLNASVEVVGKDMTQGAVKGMWLWFELRGVPIGNTISIQISENDAVIANGTMPLGSATGVKRWDVPFVSGESHTFPKGAVIKVRIASSLPGTTMQVNSADCYLLMPMTSAPVLPGVGTYYAPGKATTEFHPNWPDSVRKVITEGDIVSLFGPGDIQSVIVTIRNPSGDIASNGTGTLTGNRYANTWSYSRGQVPGNYNVTVRVLDQQGHEYLASMMISMLRYAVFVSSPQQDADEVVKGAASPPKGGSQGKDAAYSLIVLNSGFSDTTVTMRVSSNPPPGWSATLSSTSLASIAPGATANVTFTVIPDADVEYGNRAVIYVEAVADSDTRTPKASWTVQTVTNATMSRALDFSLNSPADVSVDISQKATYSMLARNKGVLDMNVTFSISGAPFGWDARFTDVTGMVRLDTGANSEKAVTLVVTAPSEEVANISRVAQLTVTAQVLEDSSLEKRVTTITRLITILGLSVDRASQTCEPGGKVDFRATISNMDPAASHPVKITVTPPASWPLTSVSFQPRETNLGANTTTTIIISVIPPATAEANLDSGYQLIIKVEPTDQPTRSNSTAIVVKLKAKVDFEMTLSAAGRDATPGQKVTLQLTVKNLGNSKINVVIFVAADIPQDWKVHLIAGGMDVLSPPNPLTVTLDPAGGAGAIQAVNLTIQPSASSRSDTTVKITLTATAGTDVKKTSAVDITVKKDLMARLRDAIVDSALVIVFCILVLLVFGVLVRRNARPVKR